jgi:DNA-binding HxlR family transcriptional regulator
MDDEYTCGVNAVVAVISGKWKGLILWAIRSEPRRFGELRRLVAGASEKVLTEQLRALEADGIVTRTAYPEVPPRVEYALSDRGAELVEVLLPLAGWAHEHMNVVPEAPGPSAVTRGQVEPAGVGR